jgi:TolB-like protein
VTALPLALAALLGAAFVIWNLPQARRPEQTSLAILPLVTGSNVSFANDLTNALITQVAHANSIPVRSYQAVSRFRGSHVSDQQVARELGVSYLLKGTIDEISGGTYRIRADLLDPWENEVIFSQDFEGGMDRIVQMEAQLAAVVTGRIWDLLDPADIERLTQHVIVDPQSDVSVMLSQYHMGLRNSDDDLAKLYDRIAAALAADLSVCSAYLRNADQYWTTAFFGRMPPEGARILLLQAMDRISAAQPDSPWLALCRGIYAMVYDLDVEKSGMHLHRAVVLMPGNPEPHWWLAAYFVVKGDGANALSQLAEAERLDPYNRMIRIYRAAALYCARRDQEAIEECLRYAEQIQDNWIPSLIRGCAQVQQGKLTEAGVSLSRSFQLGGTYAQLAHAWLGYVYARTGRTKDAKRVLVQMSLAGKGKASGVHQAIVYAGLGDEPSALASLQAALTARDPQLLWAVHDPILQPMAQTLRSFSALL